MQETSCVRTVHIGVGVMGRFDNMIKQALCSQCGADITRSLKFYPEGLKGGRYCYECNEAWKKRNKKVVRRPSRRKGNNR